MNVICTKNAPAAVGPYSQAIDCSDLVFLSGQIPLVPETGLVADGGLEAQAHQMFANIKAVLAEAGMSLSNVVKTTVFMTDLSQFAAFNAVYAEYFKAPYPARSCVEVSALPKGVLVECELIAKR
jgi:2-iminobutanoate/2-iminopropanoate deaminase